MMNRKLIISISLSITAHLAIFAALFALGLIPFELRPMGDGIDVTFVGVVGGGHPSPSGRELEGGNIAKNNPSPQPSPTRGEGGTSNELTGSNSTSGSLTGDPTLAKIRNKIARNKYYPTEARKGKLEGKPKVSFRINGNGGVELVEISESSGNEILDNAAIETVRRGAPYPVFDGEIKIAIKYSLEE